MFKYCECFKSAIVMFPGFVHPFSCVLAGPSKCGKTMFVQKVLKGPHLYIDPCPERVMWCFGVRNEQQMQKIERASAIPVEFVQGVPDVDVLSPNTRTLIILDDLMQLVGKNATVSDLFTNGSHHRNVSVFLIIQNIFHQGKFMRDIHTSCDYSVLFNNPRDLKQISIFGGQCFPSNRNYFVASYNDACSRPFGYLLIDFRQAAERDFRLMTGLFYPEVFVYYHPTNKHRRV